MNKLYHTINKHDLVKLNSMQMYKPQSFESEGFIHLAYKYQLSKIISKFYARASDMNVVTSWLVALCSVCFSILPIVSHAEDTVLKDLFQKRNVSGTIVISSLDGKYEYIHNDYRAEERFLPASTFKIPNTLIALEEEAISSEKEVIEWNGNDYGWNEWNKDQTLQTAFPLSCVWCYQELAKRVGNEKYIKHLRKISYGNQKTGKDITTFWLDGELKISATEQIDFLKKVYLGSLPYKMDNIALLRELMVEEKNSRYVIRAKTGWARRITPQIGWYVGYVELKDNVWFFAMNMEITSNKERKFRKEITYEALSAKGII